MRSGKYILITPTVYSIGALTGDVISKMEMDGALLGGGKPSKEFGMHLACYHCRNDVNAIVHVHPTYAVAVSCLKDSDCECAMPIYTAGYNARVGKLPIVQYAPPGSAELAAMTADIISQRDSVMLANHGIVTVEVSFSQHTTLRRKSKKMRINTGYWAAAGGFCLHQKTERQR